MSRTRTATRLYSSTAHNQGNSAEIIPLDSATNRADNPQSSQIDIPALMQSADSLEIDLDALSTQLEHINRTARDKLRQQDNTAQSPVRQIADVYQSLGELDEQYLALQADFEHIHHAAKKLSQHMLALTQGKRSQRYSEQLAERAIRLSHKAAHTTQALKMSMNENALALKTLAGQTLNEGEIHAINDEIQVFDASLKRQHNDILRLQSVDKTLEKRAEQIEAKTRALSHQADTLLTDLTTLITRSEAVQAHSQKNRTLIGSLQRRTDKLGWQLADLETRESRHFRYGITGLLAVLLTMLVYTVFDQRQANQQAQLEASSQTAAISQTREQLTAASDAQFVQAQQQLASLDATLSQTIAVQHATVDAQLHDIDQRLESIRGQVAANDPFSQFGSDNIIHDVRWLKNWLATPDNPQYLIDLGDFATRQHVYDAALRYGRYLTQPLAMFPVNSQTGLRYVLVMTQLGSHADALNTANQLPRINGMEAIVAPVTHIKPLLIKASS